MTDFIGQQLGNYRLTRLLGRGGFAEVYLGEHIHLGTNAAIKVLKTQVASEDVERFRNEARLIANLDNPHIVRVLDFGVQDSTPFLVMAYAANGTLRQRHPRGKIVPLDTVVSYVKQVAEALQYAHEHKLIHRDIKPENMLLGPNNQVWLSDFGIALIAQSTQASIKDIAGSFLYMAPEQIQGQPRTASDQYALGVVVYEWLCGVPVFAGTHTELAAQHMFTPPPLLRQKLPTLSPALEAVVSKVLAKDPRQRFANVREFAVALEEACQLRESTEGVSRPEQGSDVAPMRESTEGVSRPEQRSDVAPTTAVEPSAGSSEYVAYGEDAQEPYVPMPQPYSPAPTVHQAYAQTPSLQSYTPPAAGSGTPVPTPLPPSYAQPPSAPLETFGSAPTYITPVEQPQSPPSAPPGATGAVSAYNPPVEQPATPLLAFRQQKLTISVGSNVLLIALAIIVVLGGSGGFLIYHFLTLPQPVISVISKYQVGPTLAGSTSTVFHVSGQKFSANSAVTFLLDGVPAPGSKSEQSDASGNVMVDLTVTAGWSLGNHILTARDAGSYSTKSGFAVVIVPQGEANTPGPHGAPADDMSFSLNMTIQAQDTTGQFSANSFSETLEITGRPDPAGGSVCQSQDDGQPQTFSGDFANGTTYTKTIVFQCSGRYRAGKLTYIEKAIKDEYMLPDGASCTANTSFITEKLIGTFSSGNTISGTYSADGSTVPCSDGSTVTIDPGTGIWTGTL